MLKFTIGSHHFRTLVVTGRQSGLHSYPVRAGGSVPNLLQAGAAIRTMGMDITADFLPGRRGEEGTVLFPDEYQLEISAIMLATNAMLEVELVTISALGIESRVSRGKAGIRDLMQGFNQVSIDAKSFF